MLPLSNLSETQLPDPLQKPERSQTFYAPVPQSQVLTSSTVLLRSPELTWGFIYAMHTSEQGW